MLQQILKDMYIEPELLAELSEHQKELLFVKMREEQVRRWKKWDEDEKSVKKPKTGGKSIDWLLGRDGCPWVWVMGEHKNDLTIEQILEKESQEKARLLAQKEAEEKRLIEQKKEEERMKRKQKEKEEKQRKLKEEEERLRKQDEEIEAEKKRAAAEAYASLKEMRLQKEKLEREEAEKKRREKELKEKQEQLKREKDEQEKERKLRAEQLQREEEIRREELYMSLKKLREEQKKAAMKEKDQAEELFKVQLRECKKLERERSQRAKIAREEVRRSRMSRDFGDINLNDIISSKTIIPPEQPPEEEKPALPARKRRAPRPPKPTSHKSVVEWFQKEESLRNAGLVKETKDVAPWFHGIISRQQAEYLLYPQAPGYFLVRVSERVWGYALSFRDKDRAKHFLIDAAGDNYHFFGQDQKEHESLEDLVKFHMEFPISVAGKEVLKTPCGQNANPPDYQELFANLQNHNTSL